MHFHFLGAFVEEEENITAVIRTRANQSGFWVEEYVVHRKIRRLNKNPEAQPSNRYSLDILGISYIQEMAYIYLQDIVIFVSLK